MSPSLRRRLDALALPATLAAVSCILLATDALWRIDALIYDVATRMSAGAAPPDIVIAAIDERSLEAFGRWPWPRSLHADLVDRLTEAGARAVVFDVAFAEPGPDDDVLAAALRRNGRVVLPVLFEQPVPGGRPTETLPAGPLAAAAAALGHVDIELDDDGLARTAYLKAGMGRPSWSFLALAALEAAGESPGPVVAERDPHGDSPAAYLWVRDRRILVPFIGPPGSFRRVSYVDVIDRLAPASTLAGAFIVVGPTAVGIGDALPTPVSGAARPMPGVEYAANVLHALRAGSTARYLGMTASLLATAVIVGLAALWLTSTGATWGAWLVTLGLITISSLGLLEVAGVWYTPTPALVGVTIGLAIATRRERRLETQQLSRERHRLEATLGTMGDGVISVDADGRVEYLNAVAERWLSRGLADTLGRPLADVLHLVDEQTREQLPLPAVDAPGGVREALVNAGEAEARPVRVSAVAVRDARGHPEGLVVVLADRSEAPPAGEAAGRVGVDPLTDLPNRARMEARLANAIARARRDGRWVGVLFMDLDRFRVINRGLGARGGDQLLRDVAARLRTAVREADDVARVAGDEFVILLNNVSKPEDARALSRRILDELQAPFDIEGVGLSVDASIGVSLFPRDGNDPDTLLRRADLAVRWAKEHSHDRIQVFDRRMSTPALDRFALEQHLRGALDRGELGINYQPQIALATGAMVGVEALVRWRHPQLGDVSPAIFVPVAEETGLIVAIGEWTLERACRQVREWDDAGLPPLRLSVNVSPRQFLDPQLGTTIARCVGQVGLRADRLALEITESALVKDTGQAVAIVRSLKALGLEIALDDFGVGYSSLSYLKHFPIDRLKIDKSFVRDLVTDHDDRTICAGVVAMAHSRQRRVTAEGVETAEQLAFLRAQGCDEVQGFLVSPPLEADELAEFLRLGAVGLPG